MRDRIIHWTRASWVDIAWVAFILLNLLAMRLFAQWQTVPFLVIWLSLTTLYGFRLWHRLMLAMDALIENAIDHTPEGGEIGLGARCKDERRRMVEVVSRQCASDLARNRALSEPLPHVT